MQNEQQHRRRQHSVDGDFPQTAGARDGDGDEHRRLVHEFDAERAQREAKPKQAEQQQHDKVEEEEESGEKKLTDRGLTGLKARFSMKRKGSMSDVTADGVSSEDDTAEEAAAPFTPPMPRYATIAGA